MYEQDGILVDTLHGKVMIKESVECTCITIWRHFKCNGYAVWTEEFWSSKFPWVVLWKADISQTLIQNCYSKLYWHSMPFCTKILGWYLSSFFMLTCFMEEQNVSGEGLWSST